MEAEQFGEYTLVRCLAIGGMGELYLAQREGVAGFSKQLVVKRIRPELAGDGQFVEMFLNEGRLAAMLDHPNVVHIYELGEVEGAFFMAMEYVAGKNLGTVLSHHGGPLELSIALGVINGICEGIGFAHDAIGHDGQPLNLVHRDINPQNVLISFSGTVKIADFGIAKAHLQQRKETQAGVLKGKFGYLSPEQARSGRIDRRSDIYTLGLLLFEATIGQPAIPGKTDTQLLYAAAEGIVQRPTDFTPDYPAELERIYLKATAKLPGDRYQAVKELQEDLLSFQLDQRLVVTSSKLADLMRRLFPGEHSGERRVPTPARAASSPAARVPSWQIRPPNADLGPDEDVLHAPTMIEDRGGSQPGAPAGPIARDISQDRTQLARQPERPPDHVPDLAMAETRMLDRPPQEPPPPAAASPELLHAETRMLKRDDESVDELRVTTPQPRAQATDEVEPGAKQRSRWPVILISTLVTLMLAGGAAYYLLYYRPLHAGPTGPTGPTKKPGRHKKKPRVAQAPGVADAGASRKPPDAGRAVDVRRADAAGRADARAPDSATPGISSLPDASRGSRVTPVRPVRAKPALNRVAIASKPKVWVYWRGEHMGQTPLNIELPPGQHTLALRNRDLEIRVSRRITVPRRGITARVDLLVEQGTLVVKARPWAHVEINGTRRGTTPIKPLKLYEGTYSVKLVNTEHGTHSVKITIRPGEATSLVHVFKKDKAK